MNEITKSDRILIVDDTLQNIQVLGTILRREGYQINVAQNGIQALELLEKVVPDLILLDVMMPELNGFECCRRLKASERTKDIPIIFLTAKVEKDDIIQGLKLGAVDYIVKPFDSTELLVRVQNHLMLYKLQKQLLRLVDEKTAALRQALRELRSAHLDTIQRLVVAAEYKDQDTAFHIKRMAYYSALLAKRLGMAQEEVELVLHASSMHDIGKIGTPESILLKPGKLDDDEWEIMKQHTIIGAKILDGSPSELLQVGRIICLSHHEKWDGSGYPQRLAGEDIPLYGRICAVADVFDALTSKRPYKEAFPFDKAVEILREGKSLHFDPQLVDLFIQDLDEVRIIQRKYSEGSFESDCQ